MKLKSLYALLFCIFMTGCLDGQKQSDHSILIAYMSTEYPELGSSVCYLNEQGDTIVPFGKYHYGGSDTIRHIGFVMEDVYKRQVCGWLSYSLPLLPVKIRITECLEMILNFRH